MVLRRLRGIDEAGPHPGPDELAAYRGHALSSPRIAQIERHLRSCDRCAAVYRRERIVDQKLAYSSPRRELLKLVQRNFRPRPLRQLGTVLVRKLGEQLRLSFLPAPMVSLSDTSTLLKSRRTLSRRTRPAAHPASAARRGERLASLSANIERLSAAEEFTFSEAVEIRCETFDEGEIPASVTIPADAWKLELSLMKGVILLRLSSLEKASAEGIRVQLARKGGKPSDVVTDSAGRLRLPLESGVLRVTVHTDPPFALDLEFPDQA